MKNKKEQYAEVVDSAAELADYRHRDADQQQLYLRLKRQ